MVWFESRPFERAATRFQRRQYPIFLSTHKVPGDGPADVYDLTAWTAEPFGQATLAQPIGLLL